jgi:hypothetical protein
LGPLERANLNQSLITKVGVSLPSTEEGSRSKFRHVVFSNYLEFRAMDKFQKAGGPECYTPVSKLLDSTSSDWCPRFVYQHAPFSIYAFKLIEKLKNAVIWDVTPFGS